MRRLRGLAAVNLADLSVVGISLTGTGAFGSPETRKNNRRTAPPVSVIIAYRRKKSYLVQRIDYNTRLGLLSIQCARPSGRRMVIMGLLTEREGERCRRQCCRL